jgi:Tfp pilus assembly protein PilF
MLRVKKVREEIIGSVPSAAAREALEKGLSYVAERVLLDALDDDPEDISSRLGLSCVLELRGDLDRAREEAARVLEQDFQNELAVEFLTWILLRKEDFAAARDIRYRFMQACPEDPRRMMEYGSLLVTLRQEAEAEPVLVRALELDPSLSDAHTALASVRNTQGRRRDARHHFETAVALAPHDLIPHVALWAFHYGRGQPLRALRVLHQAMRAFPEEESLKHYSALTRLAASPLWYVAYLAVLTAHRWFYPGCWVQGAGLFLCVVLWILNLFRGVIVPVVGVWLALVLYLTAYNRRLGRIAKQLEGRYGGP